MPKYVPKKKAVEPRGPYEVLGACREALTYTGPEVIVSGPAGSGKSISLLLKLHLICEKVPGVRCLILRKTRASLTESGLVSLENKVLPADHVSIRRGGQRMFRQSYQYPNGSEIIVGGMDKPSKVLSTEFDVIYCQEATELREEDWETLISRLRNNVLPYQQIMGDCNPDSPTHWIMRRAEAGRLLLLHSRHEDNPALFDRKTQSYTPFGRQYLERLDAMTGTRKQRLRHGKWVQAEGVVYPEFDMGVHVVHPREVFGEHPYPPPDWRRYWSVDFGYTNPFVWQCWARDHDGRLFCYREIYRTGTIVEDHAAQIARHWREEANYWGKVARVPQEIKMRQLAPQMIVCDHDAEDRATLERHLGMSTTGARKYVKKGVQAVSEMLNPAQPGGPRLFFLSDMLAAPDGLLIEAKKPFSTVQEMGCYVWNPARDEPVKEFDHGADCVRYLINAIMIGQMWEAPEPLLIGPVRGDPQSQGGGGNAPSAIGGSRAASAVSPSPRIRWGEDMPAERRGGRLFGGGGG